uniref:Major facilitator superfamily (MFS) profile domain-containing protein n=1 Tax=Scylla olivacea TaxID=85551 RepID=A0A0P4W7D1_SCYOL
MRAKNTSGDDDSAAGGSEKPPQSPGCRGNKHGILFTQDEGVQYKLVPPEGGWGWMVVLGTFIIVTLLPSLGPSFGVLFSEYLLGSGSSSTNTAWIFNLQCFLWFISGILTRPLTQELGWRPVGLIGSVMASVGIMLSAVTPNPNFLFFSFSVLTGIGGGLVTCQCFTILPHYFQRLRGLTNAIMMSGICLGQFLAPPVSRFLQDNFGFRGATLILGAIMLNATVGASLFQPFERHQKMVIVEEDPEEYVPAIPIKPKATDSPHLGLGVVHSASKSSFASSTVSHSVEAECDITHETKQRLLGRLEGWKMSDPSSRRSSKYNSTLSLSSIDAGSLAAIPLDDEEDKADAEAHKERGDTLPVRVVKSTMKDLAVLKSLRACIFCFGGVLSINGFLNFIMMVPFAMLDVGFSKDTSAWCLSVSAGCNLVTRFIVSTLSDFQWFKKRLAYRSGFVLISVSIIAFTFSTTSEQLLACMATYGVGVGACMGIYNIVIIDVMGVDLLATVFGASSFCTAIGFICIGPLIGLIRDVTQSYAVSMRITAGMLLLSLLAWMFMDLAERVDRRREAAKAVEEKL